MLECKDQSFANSERIEVWLIEKQWEVMSLLVISDGIDSVRFAMQGTRMLACLHVISSNTQYLSKPTMICKVSKLIEPSTILRTACTQLLHTRALPTRPFSTVIR